MEKNNNLQNEAREKSITLLESIKKAIETYNKLNPNSQLILNDKQTTDVRDAFVCVYNNEQVNLFKKIDYETSHRLDDQLYPYWSAGTFFIGLTSNYVGQKITHESYYSTSRWEKAGCGNVVIIDDKKYTANCDMMDYVSFDDLRLKMYDEGLIGPYEIGKATDEEIFKVLLYARGYFELENPAQKRK